VTCPLSQLSSLIRLWVLACARSQPHHLRTVDATGSASCHRRSPRLEPKVIFVALWLEVTKLLFARLHNILHILEFAGSAWMYPHENVVTSKRRRREQVASPNTACTVAMRVPREPPGLACPSCSACKRRISPLPMGSDKLTMCCVHPVRV